MPKDANIQKIVAVNADEGEPGTFKDRQIIECDPHQIIEGVIIASYAVGANRAYVYIRGELFLGLKRLIQHCGSLRARLPGQNILNSGLTWICPFTEALAPYLRRRDRHDRIAGRQAG
jgi:NADH-quinone oxidoreductase subunit F